ncbi:MAG: aldehyde dehydrogenase family protein [Candidatus Hydrogenedentes bacterium]|nr:aldehyde dehydrogenase family protein [Candidatus Hydrogenedentota bacterium]
MLRETYPYYLGNKPEAPNHALEVTDKYSGEVVARVAEADPAAIDRAIGKAVDAAGPMRALASFERRDVLLHCASRFEERAEELSLALCIEAGKPIKDSRGEVTRLIDTFRVAAEDSTRITGEIVPLDISARARNYSGMWKRVPIGPCSFISPFNFPLNLVAHKIAPALAVGCPFVLKPASRTPIGALLIGEILAETNLPEGAFSILPCTRNGAELFTTDSRLKLLSFTGSPDVGWDLKARAGKKKVVLELGGNAACIVDSDWDLDDAVKRIVFGGYYQSGQSCISVQRILVHESIYASFREKLVEVVRALKSGDPRDEETFIGPIISESAAKRIESWLQSAAKNGARILCGGVRDGVMISPAVVENVRRDEPLWSQEVFGPITCIKPFNDFDDALAEANNSAYGLQAGVFTRDLYKAQRAWDVLEVGGVLIGDVPSWRVDHMPYGGVKDSGFGREGIRYAMEEMSEMRLMVVRTP